MRAMRPGMTVPCRVVVVESAMLVLVVLELEDVVVGTK
jgi:hypothetical protein